MTCTRTTPYEKVPVCWPPDVFSLETWFKTTTTDRWPPGRMEQQGHGQLDQARPAPRTWTTPAGSGSASSRTTVGSPSPAGPVSTTVSGTTLWARCPPQACGSYIDGARVASQADVTTASTFRSATWRLGGDRLDGWPGAPTSGYFAGSLDEVAVYKTALASTQVSAHFFGRRRHGEPSPRPMRPSTRRSTRPARSLTVDAHGFQRPGRRSDQQPTSGTSVTGRPPRAHAACAHLRAGPVRRHPHRDGRRGRDRQPHPVRSRIMGPPAGSWRVSRVLGRRSTQMRHWWSTPTAEPSSPTRGTGVDGTSRPGGSGLGGPITSTPRTAPTR